MRSLTVPVSFSSLLLPAALPDLPLPFSSGASFGLGVCGSFDAGLGGGGCCGLADRVGGSTAMMGQGREPGGIPFCRRIDTFRFLLGGALPQQAGWDRLENVRRRS